MSTSNDPFEIEKAERLARLDRRNRQCEAQGQREEQRRKEEVGVDLWKSPGPTPGWSVHKALQTARDPSQREKLELTLPNSLHPSGSETPTQTENESVTFTSPTFRLPEPFAAFDFHTEVEIVHETGVVRTTGALEEDLTVDPARPSSKKESLCELRTLGDSPLILQYFKNLVNLPFASTSRRMSQPITKHSYPKFKGRSDDDDDADSYIKLFESISTTNREGDDDDRLRIFPSLLRKKARSWYNHESTEPQGIDSWLKLRTKFLKRFRELGYDSRILTKLRNL